MTPRITDRGRALLVASALAFVLGAALAAPVATAVAGGLFVLLAAAYLATLPLSRRLRAETIELAWWVDAEPSARRNRVVARSPFALRLFVRHQGSASVRIRAIEIVSDGAERADAAPLRFDVPPVARVDLATRCVCHAPGRAVLHGARIDVAGPLELFETRLYFPNRLRLAVLPAIAHARSAVHTPLDARSIPRRVAQKRRDEGTDVHELRELRPGDPFRRIAWKTSARVGRLIVREPEREELGSVDLVLDAGPSMRDGVHGERRLDRAVALALGIAEDALRRGERVGIVTADRRVLRRVEPDSRPDQREKILDALLGALSCVDADRTVEDDAAVGRAVARYVRFQEGLEFLDPYAIDGVHLERLALHVASRARGAHEIHASTETARILRRYAEMVAIPLQPRTDRDVEGRSLGLVAALRSIEPRRRAPSRIVIVTDGIDVDFVGRLRAPLMQLRRRGHAIEALLVARSLPFSRELGLDPRSILAMTYVDDDAARLRSVASAVRGLGLGVTLDGASSVRAEVA